jgi:hypothetical protein
LKLAKEVLVADTNKEPNKYSFIITIFVWLFLSAILYGALGIFYPLSSWRFLYLITGIINIVAAPLINIF